MASRPLQPATRNGTGPTRQPLVFLPRESVGQFNRLFPWLYALAGVLLAAALAVGWFLKWYMVPVMVAFPLVSLLAAGRYASRLSTARVVVDGERIRIVQGSAVKDGAGWHQITRLTIRQVQGEPFYEMWVKERAIVLPVAFFQNGEQLLPLIAERTSVDWETL